MEEVERSIPFSKLSRFPSRIRSATKKHPAVVVSSDAYQRERPDVILMAITSQLRPTPGVGEVAVAHWQAAGLLERR